MAMPIPFFNLRSLAIVSLFVKTSQSINMISYKSRNLFQSWHCEMSMKRSITLTSLWFSGGYGGLITLNGQNLSTGFIITLF